MFKKLLQKSNSEVNLKRGSLRPLHLEPRLAAHYGLPASASLMAYEPVQWLLALASRDGRIKIFGRDGVEVLFRSPTGAPCKYLEFVHNEGRLIHVTTRNDIEIWDLRTNKLLTSKTWGLEITAFAVVQGTSFLYIGDESGQVSVLEVDGDHGVLNQMNYSIFPQVTLTGLVSAGTSNAPSVVSILPQPDAVHSRVCIVYGNGILVLWSVPEAHVIAILGGTGTQQKKLAGQKSSDDDEDEDKEPCCACWACPAGTVVAVGYTDGDIWLWNLGSKSKSDHTSPLLKLCLSTEDFRMPVVVIRWSSLGKTEPGPCGVLYVFGGQEMGVAESVTVLTVLNMAAKAELPLEGPFADVLLMPGGGSNGAVLVLTSPGCVEVYEEVSINESIHSGGESSLAPTSFQLPLTFSPVTTGKLLIIPEDSIVAHNILKAPGVIKSYITPALPSGARWPVSGGILSSMPAARKCLFVTGHENGLANVWDVSSPSLYHLAAVNNRGLLESEWASIVAVDLCGLTGLLALGDESGLVFLYTMSVEPRQDECLFISKDEAPTKKSIQHAPGFQCFAVLNLHRAAISSIVVASHGSCVAIGDDAGLVTIFDLASNTVRFHGRCGTGARIVSFMVMSLPSNETSSSSSSSSSSSTIFALCKGASITAIDISNGSLIGSGRPKNPSVAISLHLLDSGGALVKSAAKSPSKKVTKQSVLMAVIETDSSGSRIEPTSASEEREEDIPQENDWIGTDNLVLLCSEDALRLYSISSVLQGMRTTVRKIRLEKPCRAASAFDAGADSFGVFLLFDSGDIEIRCLPELDVVKMIPLTTCLGWEFTSSPSFFRTFSMASNGRVAAVDADREVVFMSVGAEENDMRLPASYPMLYDNDVAAATEAALRASVQAAKKKQSQLQDMFGGVMKEIKQSLGQNEHSPSDLFKVFSRPVTSPISHGVSSIVQKLKSHGHQDKDKDRGSNNSSPEPSQVESPSEQEHQLDIDDIDLDDDDSKSPSSSSSSGKKAGVIKKLRSSFKGKKKSSKLNDDDQRNMLFEGGSTEGKPTPKMPAMRTAEEIRAAYGHKRAGEASSVAAQARDRLMERQERLQNIGRRTEEMQENAENFQSMAEELAKKMESRKWWEI